MKAKKSRLTDVVRDTYRSVTKSACFWWRKIIALSATIVLWMISIFLGGINTSLGTVMFAIPFACIFGLVFPLVFQKEINQAKLLVLFIQEFKARNRLEKDKAWLNQSWHELIRDLNMSRIL